MQTLEKQKLFHVALRQFGLERGNTLGSLLPASPSLQAD